MTKTSGDAQDGDRLDAFIEATGADVQPRSRAELDEGLDALFGRITRQRQKRRRLFRWSLVAATAALCLAAGLRSASRSPKGVPVPDPPALAYQVEGGRLLEGGYLREDGHAGIKVAFNEGSQFLLTPGSRGRLRGVDEADARLALEHGTASFQVTPSHRRRWLVEVGPFLVTVKGTVFTISWDPSSERFELRLRRGRVVVSGPISGGDIDLLPGQRLVVNLAKSETVIDEDEEAPHVQAPDVGPRPRPMDKASGPDPRPGPATVAPVPPAHAKNAGERRWAAALANGQWDRILADANRAGIDATLEGASSEDLFALANAARYRRRGNLARAALLAERKRFPDSPRGLDALFLLGRVEESSERGAARAIAWYDEYLERGASGAYVAEALGRKMTLTNELRGPQGARPVAEDYLRRFPKGSYAGSARALLRAP